MLPFFTPALETNSMASAGEYELKLMLKRTNVAGETKLVGSERKLIRWLVSCAVSSLLKRSGAPKHQQDIVRSRSGFITLIAHISTSPARPKLPRQEAELSRWLSASRLVVTLGGQMPSES